MVAGSGHAERNFRESENSSAIQIQVQIHAIKKSLSGFLLNGCGEWTR